MITIKYFSDDFDVQNKKVILRLDLNVPLKKKEIQDKTRILLNLPFLEILIKKKAKIIAFFLGYMKYFSYICIVSLSSDWDIL